LPEDFKSTRDRTRCGCATTTVKPMPTVRRPPACTETVSKPLKFAGLRDLPERKADSPSCCFYSKWSESRRGSGGGACAPKAGALPGCATPRLEIDLALSNNFGDSSVGWAVATSNRACLTLRAVHRRRTNIERPGPCFVFLVVRRLPRRGEPGNAAMFK
jgi:hypothetical protein